MKNVMLFCAALLATAEPAVAELSPWQGEPMDVEGDMIDGRSIVCAGAGCAMVLDSLYREYLQDLALLGSQPGLLEGDGQPAFLVERSDFCERLEDRRPAGCSRSSAPPVPGIDPTWRPNGCGVGGWKDAALAIVANLGLRHFTGDLDAPFPGVSFLSACNAHDRCYGYQISKIACDGTFRLAMISACDQSTLGDAREICYGSVSAYHVAVLNYGDSAYEEAGEDLACARWHLDMSVNGCTT
ncbi:MAG: hypothetical protein P8172_15010 [Gammaproteobacteria bacterium]|jgi:hypothetical protein